MRTNMQVRVLVAAAVLGALDVFCGSAAAATRPHIVWRLPSTGNAGAATPFTYSVTGASKGSTIVVQRQEGTGQVWKTIATLRGRAGSGSLPSFAIGRFTPRLAVLGRPSHHQTSVLASATRSIAVFGTVPFSSLLKGFDGYTSDGVQVTATGAFTYVFDPGEGTNLTGALAIGPKNPCRQITVQFLSVVDDSGPDLTTAQIVQQSADPVSASVQLNSVGTVTANVVPGQSWGLNLQSPFLQYHYYYPWYINGSGVCDSTVLPNP
jgi:hypothetical protein